MEQPWDGELRRVEVPRVRPEANRGTGVAASDGADHLESVHFLTAFERHCVFASAAFHAHLETSRQRIDHGDPDPVQSAREPVAPLRELAARMEPGEDELDARNAFVGMDVDGHPAAVVADRQRIVPVRDDRELARLSGDRLVDAVVDDFLRKVIRPGGIGVHARTLAHGVEACQHLDRSGVVCRVHHRGGEHSEVPSAFAHRRKFARSDARRRPLTGDSDPGHGRRRESAWAIETSTRAAAIQSWHRTQLPPAAGCGSRVR